jgi:RHS repeat-associated protein
LTRKVGKLEDTSYDPYGSALQATAALADFGYAGMFYNAESGLYLTQYRAYDPVASRWLSRDPLGEDERSSHHLYRYVNGNPTATTDPSGRFGAAGAAIGALVGGCAALGDIGSQLARNGGNSGDNVAVGLYGGAGLGGFITNSSAASELAGPFTTWSVNTPIGSVQVGYSGGTWIASATYGPGFIGSVSSMVTNTWTAGR